MSPNKRLLFETTMDAPIEAVWSAVRDPKKIAQWFGWGYDGLSDEIDQIFISGVTADADEHSIQFGSADEMTLKADGERTIFATYRPTADADPMIEMAADIDEGWFAFVEQLRFWLGRHPGEERANVYVSGSAKEHYGSLQESLGFPSPAEAGAPYAATLPDGTKLQGQVWSRRENVACFTVAAYGDGLIVLIDHDATRNEPNGGGMVIITTYGQSEKQISALKQQWAQLWASKYEASAEFGAEQAES